MINKIKTNKTERKKGVSACQEHPWYNTSTSLSSSNLDCYICNKEKDLAYFRKRKSMAERGVSSKKRGLCNVCGKEGLIFHGSRCRECNNLFYHIDQKSGNISSIHHDMKEAGIPLNPLTGNGYRGILLGLGTGDEFYCDEV